MQATAPTGGTERRTVTFAIGGLSPRDETLFKSFVRLLAHRMEHAWKATSGEADVLVVAQGQPRTGAGRCTLVVGASPQGEPHFARIPFQADDLEAALNKAGASIGAQRAGATAASDKAGASVAPRAAGEVTLTSTGALVRLLRWPPPRLLTTSGRIRVATLLSTQALPLAALSARSGCEMLACTEFLAELAREELVTMVRGPIAPAAPVRVRTVDAGLVARIRQRLGGPSEGE
jgi:hypothetical protein